MSFISKILIGITSWLIIACTCASEREAKLRGESDAKALIESLPMSDMDIQNMLLEVRSNEYDYRSLGQDEEADEYIGAFTDYMRLYCDSLAGKLAM